MKKLIGNFKGNNLYLAIASYQNNNRIYIGVETEEEMYADVTINLSDKILPDDNYIFVSNDMTRELRSFLKEKEIIGETLTTIPYNMGRYDMVKVNFDILKEYDYKGFDEFSKSLKLENRNLEVEL